MRKTSETVIDDEQPLQLSAAMRAEACALLAPMDRSVAGSVTAVVTLRRSHHRLLQSVWLGLSPVMAVAIVGVMYAGGAMLPRWLSSAGPQRAFTSPNPQIGVTDSSIPKVAAGSEGMSALTTGPSFRILLDGDVARRQLLAIWLRAGHADVAAELESAVPGKDVLLTLEPEEVDGFSSLMALHGFVGQEPSGLRILPRHSAESWSSSLGISSMLICIVP